MAQTPAMPSQPKRGARAAQPYESSLPDDYAGLQRVLLAEAMLRPKYYSEWLDLLVDAATDLAEAIEGRA